MVLFEALQIELSVAIIRVSILQVLVFHERKRTALITRAS